MTIFNQCVYEMLVRVLLFIDQRLHLLAEDSPMTPLIQKLKEAVQKLAAYAVSERSGKHDERISAEARAQARGQLRNQLGRVSRTGRGLKLGRFCVPVDGTDTNLVELGHVFAENAEPVQELFIASHMPANFLDELKDSTRSLDQIMKDQVINRDRRLTAGLEIAKTRSEALAVLQCLDPMAKNLFWNDPTALAVWDRARRIERYSKPADPGDANEAEDPPGGAADTGATAATA